MITAVDMRLKPDAVIFDALQPRQRKNLIAARIRQNRQVPVHERMKPARAAQHIQARSQIEMVAVRKKPLHAGCHQFVGRKRFHAAHCGNRKKAGSL